MTVDTLSDEKLAACPFCGGPARLTYSHRGEVHQVRCNNWTGDAGSKSCMGGGAYAYTEVEAATAWNRRAALPPPEGDVGELVDPEIVASGLGPTLDEVMHTLRPCVRVNEDGSFVAPKDEALSDLLTLAASMQRTIYALSRQLPTPTGEVEPVAWRYTWDMHTAKPWSIGWVRLPDDDERRLLPGFIEQPLYAAPVVASAKAGEPTAWRLEWANAPRDGTWVRLRYPSGDETRLVWSTHYSINGLGGCWTDGFCTMSDLDFTGWLAAAHQSPMGEGTVGVKWKTVPVEATPEMLAAVAPHDEPASADDYALALSAVDLLPPTHHPEVGDVLADMARDYRAMVAAAPSRQGTGK